jgi:hypothetical protein
VSPTRIVCRRARVFFLFFVLAGCGILPIPCSSVALLDAQMMGGVQVNGRSQPGSTSSSLPPSSASSTTAVAPSTVVGKVINAKTGAPVPRALVRINSRAMLTDHDGNFRFEQNTDTTANVLVTKPGYSTSVDIQDSPNMFLQAAQLGAPIELRLYPEAVLTGTVLAPDGTPLPHIAVNAMRSIFDETSHRWMNVGQDQTDSHGNFRVPVPAGEYRLETRYSPADRTTGEAVLPVTVPNEASTNTAHNILIHSGEELHFELRPAVSPTHTVTFNTQLPAGRDFTRIIARSSNGSTLQVNPQPNGGGGETKIQLPQGTFTLTATRNNPDSPEEAETTVTVGDHDISGVPLQFSSIPSIPVELVLDSSSSSDGAQAPNVQQFGLTLQSNQPDPERGDSMVRVVAKRDQTFAFTAPPGTYRLQGRDTGLWYIKAATYGASDLLQQELVVVPGSGGTPIRITVSNQTAALQGVVNLNGNPASCWVYLIPGGSNAQSVITLHSGTTGSYTAAHLPPGNYQAIAFERRHSANYRDPESLAAYRTFVHSVSVQAGDKPTLNLDAVPATEVAP